MTSLDPVPRPSLERGTALSTIYTTAEQQRQAAESLRRAAEDHALTVHAFVTAIANGEEPDPAPVLRSRGRVEALVEELLDEHTGEGDAFAELRVVLAEHPDADPALEAIASLGHDRPGRARVGGCRLPPAPLPSPSASLSSYCRSPIRSTINATNGARCRSWRLPTALHSAPRPQPLVSAPRRLPRSDP